MAQAGHLTSSQRKRLKKQKQSENNKRKKESTKAKQAGASQQTDPQTMDTNQASGETSDADSDISDLDPSSRAKPRKSMRIPPIVIVTPVNVMAFANKLKMDQNDPNIKFQTTRTGLKIFPTTEAQFKNILEKLKQDAQMNFFYHPLPGDKLKHVVLKGLPDVDVAEITTDLAEQGYQPSRVVKMKSHPGIVVRNPLFLVSYSQATNLKDVRNIRYICSMRIKWERFKNTRKVTRCHRCQGFGHGTTGCHVRPKCVKCAGDHLTSECTTQQEKPKCANCLGEHTANFSGCQAYIDRLKYIESQKSLRSKMFRVKEPAQQRGIPTAATAAPTQIIQSSHGGRQDTYASRVQAQSPPPPPRAPQSSQIVTEAQPPPGLRQALSTAQRNYAEITSLNTAFEQLREVINLTEMRSFIEDLTKELRTCGSNKLAKFNLLVNYLTPENGQAHNSS